MSVAGHGTRQSSAARQSVVRRTNLLAAGLILAYVMLVAPSLGQSLVENHAYRQTQTAYTAVLFASDGIDLLRPPLPVLGPPGVVPLEFPLFQAVGAVGIMLGLPADFAMRLLGLLSFLASAGLLFLLARRLLGERGGLLVLGAFLINGHAILYGRAVLIEYLATAFGLAFLIFVIRWMEDRRPVDWLVALGGAAGVLLVKITTAPILLVPALLWSVGPKRRGYQLPWLWAVLAVSLSIGLGWSQYADAVRSGSPATEFLSARNSLDWFFGTIDQRLDLAAWRIPIASLLALTGSGLLVWAYLATRFGLNHPQRGFLLVLLLIVAATPLILFNLYAIHEYYYAALAPYLALAVGMGAEHLLRRPRTANTKRLMVGLAGAWAATLVGTFGSWSLIYGTPAEEEQVFEAAAFVREHSDPHDWVVIEGFGWNSTFLYYAQRRGFADPTGDNLLEPGDLDVDAILSDPIYGPFFTCDAEGNCTVSERR